MTRSVIPPYAGVPRGQIPHDHPEYARRTLNELCRYWGVLQADALDLERTLAEIEAARIWERWPAEQPCGSLDALCQAVLGQSEQHVRQRGWVDQ
jgi:hypothetical protein